MKFKHRIYFLFFIALVLVFLSGCNLLKSNGQTLEKDKFTDVMGVYHDVYLVNDHGLMSLYKYGKKISKEYLSLESLVGRIYNQLDNWHYFLAQDEKLNYYLIDGDGVENKLDEKYLRLVNVYNNIIVFELEDMKYGVLFLDSKREMILDDFKPLYNAQNLFLATKESKENSMTSLIDTNGETILSNIYSTEAIYMSYDAYKPTYYKFQVDYKYVLLDLDGRIVTGKMYDSIERFYHSDYPPYFILKCNNVLEDGYTYVNSSGKSIAIEKENNTVIISSNHYIVTKDNATEELTFYTYNGDVRNKFISARLQNNLYYLVKFEDRVIFLSTFGYIIYEIFDPEGHHEVLSHYTYVVNNDAITYFVINANDKIVLANSLGEYRFLSFPMDYKIELTNNRKLLIVKKGLSGDEMAILDFDNIPDNEMDLTFYNYIRMYEKFIIFKNPSERSIEIVDIQNRDQKILINTTIPYYVFPIVYVSVEQNSFKLSNKKYLETMQVDIISTEQKVEKTLVVYWYNNGPMQSIELSPGSSFTIQNSTLIEKTDDKSRVYQIDINDNSIEIKEPVNISRTIQRVLKDRKENYYVFKFNDSNGLLNSKDEIVLYPHFDDIIGIYKKNVVVKKNGLYGVVKLQKGGKYKVVLNIIYSDIQVLNDMLLVIDHQDEAYFYNYSGSKLIKDKLTYAVPIIYTTKDSTDEKGYISKEVYKVYFGSYVKLLHYEFE